MANNQYVNKVQYGDTTLVDLTSDTVTESTLMEGYTAHDASGAPITGIASPMSPYISDPAMDGTASAGSSNDYARGDHVHPTDTSRAAASHAHGDITSGGDITASSATVAPGDCIVINDDSENKITNGPAFGSDTTKFLRNDGTWQLLEMTILSYGHSTWTEAEAAFLSHNVVYCRASSNSNPATGAQNRMAFLAYTNNQTAPTEFEFQYYRSVSSHSASQQGDQVYVYKLNKNNGWSVIVREAYTKIAVGSTMTSSYSGGTLTLNANSYTLPTMATNTKGGAKLGNGLSITDDVLSVDASDVANGQLPIAHGGTGATTAAGARTNLGVLEYSNGVLDVDGTSAYLLFKTSSIANFAAPTGVGECAVMDTSDDSIYWHDGSTYTRLNPKDNLTDSGWVVLRASNNATTGRYRKLGSVVYLDISLGAPEQITVDSSGVYIGTLPEGYRPSDTIVTAATIMTSGSGQLTIETGGGVRAYNFATASKYLAAFIAFPVG